MEYFKAIIDFILHIDKHLVTLSNDYGIWVYLILFLIIFCETGLVVTPFLPGDSLLFAAGAIAALPGSVLNVVLLGFLLLCAAVLGDTVNYNVGRFIGTRAYTMNSRFIKKEHLDKTHVFYEKHGGRAIIYARFIPIIRTFAPFIAGVAAMKFSRYISFCIGGGILWIFLFLGAGYLFGNIPVVKNNFSIVIVGIIVLSLVPVILQYFKSRSVAK
jgi:membrane-associated protein